MAAGRAIALGWLLPAKMFDLHGELLVQSCRMVFVKDTSPAQKVNGLVAGKRLHVLGMPRMNLAEIDLRVRNSAKDPQALSGYLPYEMVIVGMY
jgi:hypothetical protein